MEELEPTSMCRLEERRIDKIRRGVEESEVDVAAEHVRVDFLCLL